MLGILSRFHPYPSQVRQAFAKREPANRELAALFTDYS